MILFAGIVFFLSLTLIFMLFALKLREMETGKVIAANFKRSADLEALRVKELVFAANIDLKKLPHLAVFWGQEAIHFAALEFARLARGASLRAHQLADFVSHKRNFQRRTTRSEFLKKMAVQKREALEMDSIDKNQ